MIFSIAMGAKPLYVLAKIQCYLSALKSWHNNLFLSGVVRSGGKGVHAQCKNCYVHVVVESKQTQLIGNPGIWTQHIN